MSERRPGGVREASGRRPGGIREASGRRPKRVLDVSETCPKGARGRIGLANLKKSGRTARDCPIFSVRIVKLPSVFDDFDGGAFSTASAMDLHDFAKPPRLCRKFKIAAPVQKI